MHGTQVHGSSLDSWSNQTVLGSTEYLGDCLRIYLGISEINEAF